MCVGEATSASKPHYCLVWKHRAQLEVCWCTCPLREGFWSPGRTVVFCCHLGTQSCPTLCDPMAVAYQASLSMGFPRQEFWSGLPLPSPGDLPEPGIKPVSPALTGRFFYHWATREALPGRIPLVKWYLSQISLIRRCFCRRYTWLSCGLSGTRYWL